MIFESKHEHLVNRKKERVTQSKNKAKTTQIVHAHFTCYEYVLKKFTALNYTNKRMTLACQFRALLPDSEESRETRH